MRVSEIVLQIRENKKKIVDSDGNLIFDNRIAGAAELDFALKNTLLADTLFVIPLLEDADPNEYDNSVNQIITQRFGIVVGIGNDKSQRERTGIVAFDTLHYVRAGLIRALMGWAPSDAEGILIYRGGRILRINNAYLFWQYEFEYKSRLYSCIKTETDPASGNEIQHTDYVISENDYNYNEKAYDWKTIYANIIVAPSARLPHTGDLPLDDNFPNVKLPDNAAIYINMTRHPDDGEFWRGFGSAFEKYEGD